MYVRKKSLGLKEIDWKNALLAHDQYFTTFCEKETWTYLKYSDWKCLENRFAGSWLILRSLNAEILDFLHKEGNFFNHENCVFCKDEEE